jgi:tRNA(Arg) A34 adenosine deaminase TadA
MSSEVESFMRIAIEEARLSLREGNHGFGAVIVRDGRLISQAHDVDETERDATAHAEMTAIRRASALVGKDLSGCRLYSTHEPCPMCATAIVWSKISSLGYGFGIADALDQGRTRIDLGCRELFDRAQAIIEVEKGILYRECAPLYNKKVRAEIKKLRGATDLELQSHNRRSSEKRTMWIQHELQTVKLEDAELLRTAYELLLKKLDISEDEAPIAKLNKHELVFHSRNGCPTLEACKILGLDTRRVCKLYNEGATREMMKAIDPRLSFNRNYGHLRPYSNHCEEMITLE